MVTSPHDPSGAPPIVVPGERPTRVRYMVFVLGFGTSWMLYLHRYSFALIKPVSYTHLTLPTILLV